MLIAALLGFVIGFVGSVPVAGAVSLLVFERGLRGRAGALRLAIGAALCEGVYAGLAFAGFGALLGVHPWIEPIARGATAVILIALGLLFARKRTGPPMEEARRPSEGDARSFVTGLVISALNPTLLITWGGAVAMLHSFGVVEVDPGHAVPFGIGACLGISGWFAVLLALLGHARTRVRRSTLEGGVRLMGVALALLGLFLAIRLLVSLLGHTA